MPQTGFEPVHGYPYNDLNVARLPVPPLGHLKCLVKAKKPMPQTGFEPVHGHPYNDLNVARLPVPPLGHLNFN